MVFEFWNQKACEMDEVVVDDADDMEAIGDDAGVGKVLLNEPPVRT